jgi:Tol biopolymer transport system component
MPLQAGARLGPYEIISAIGAGGMGEVYVARDTRLERTVAIKILPGALSADPERRQRFEREARVIASLSHPQICALHDVGSATTPGSDQPVEYLVMEYLDGETLARRLSRGALPLDEVIRAGSEIAIALEAAHRLRIVHRDLKPANVMLTRSGVKLLDFGLAKAIAPEPDGGSVMTAIAEEVTAVGTVLGTLPYMSPEQVEGRDTDARSDMFAFGAVLYEMAAGRRAFAGDSPAAVAAAILAADPPPLTISPSLDRLVRGCLAKDPDRRWQSTQDVALQLGEVIDRDRLLAARPAPGRASVVPWVIAALAAIVAIGAAGVAWRARGTVAAGGPSGAGGPVAFTIPPPGADGYFTLNAERMPFAISPDGRQVAFAGGVGNAPSSLWLRPLSSQAATSVPGSEGATSPFWSPDGESIGFFASGKLKRVDLAGGTPVPICDVQAAIGFVGTWGDGQILYASVEGAQIFRVPATGGAPVALIRRDDAKQEDRITWPSFLPDGRRFFYMSGRGGVAGVVMLGSLDGPSREVLPVRSNAQYVDPGFIVYGADGALLARRFDPVSGEARGEPVAIAESANQFLSTGLAHFSASRGGAVIFHTGQDLARIVKFDREGRESAQLRPPGGYSRVRLAAGGRDLLIDQRVPQNGTIDIWRLEIERGADSRVTSDPGSELNPVMAPDGSLIFSAATGGAPRLYRRPLSGPDEPLAPALSGMQSGADVSPDGKWVVYHQRMTRGKFDLIAVSLPDRRTAPFQQSDAAEANPRFSPDGRHVAFESDLGGRVDVYVAPFPGPGPTRIVSTTAGAVARWSADGRELFYVGQDGTVYVVPIATTPALEIGRARPLFTRGSRARWTSFEPTRDGGFIALDAVRYGAEQPMHVILNWPALVFGGGR